MTNTDVRQMDTETLYAILLTTSNRARKSEVGREIARRKQQLRKVESS